MLWIPITLAASFFQTIRLAVQKWLSGRLTVMGSAFTRFLYGMPFAWIFLAVLWHTKGPPGLVEWPPAFFIWTVTGSAAQIFATILQVKVFSTRNFGVGIAYAKTEIVQAAAVGALLLGDHLPAVAIAGILVATAGVTALSVKGQAGPREILAGWTSPAARMGMAAGTGFALSAVSFRGASLSLGLNDPFLSAAIALAASTATQTVMMAALLAWREPGQLKAVFVHWKPSLAAGITSFLGSAGWFTAMTLERVAYVRTLGLVELLFAFSLAAFWFKERPQRAEILGSLLIGAGIILVLSPGFSAR